jgi:SAM-dependent methyltransferase
MAKTEQSKIWNESVGEAWVEHAAHFDATLAPFGRAAIERLAVQPHERVIDIGCGTGATTVEIARLANAVTGVDLSVPMLAAAGRRADAMGLSNIDWLVVDVEATGLEVARFDAAYSRFGVMFFEDPVAAFTNIANALVNGGRLGFVCFQSPLANPFIVVPVMAAARVLQLVAPSDPHGPGPFSLADPQRINDVLTAAGFIDIVIKPGPTEASLGDATDLTTLARRLLEQNPVTAPAFAVAIESVRIEATVAAAEALAPYCTAESVTLGASTWIVTATTPQSR